MSADTNTILNNILLKHKFTTSNNVNTDDINNANTNDNINTNSNDLGYNEKYYDSKNMSPFSSTSKLRREKEVAVAESIKEARKLFELAVKRFPKEKRYCMLY